MKKSVRIATQRLKSIISLLLIVYSLLPTVNLQADTYPINAQLSTIPPYSISFTDFSLGSNIQFSMVDRRIDADMQQVYLNIELEGGGIKLKTLPSFRPSSYIDVIPGNMLTLTNTDLMEYFGLNSLGFEGISKEAFAASGQLLPEGLYKLKIKAIHMTMGVQVSNEALAIMGLFKGQPPFINLPMNNTKVNENPTQNFSINWTNRNSATFNQANLPSYRVQMWEMLDASQDPNIIVNSNYPPILDDFTNMTTYQHGMSNTPLTAGKSYVLRVQVLDPDGRDVYSNGGYSQVVKFTYGDACNPPTNLTAVQDTRGIQVNWALTPNQGGYRFQYGRIDTAWTDADVLINRFQIEKIYPSAQYQMRVSTLCSGGKQSEYSNIVYLTTKASGPDNLAACGDPFPKIEFKSKTLLPSLNVGDKFTAFDFDLTVTRVLRNDSTSYKGVGTTPFNMLGGVPTVVYFDGIQINTDRQLIGDGSVKFQQKPYVFSDKNIKQFKEDFKDTKEMMTGDDSADPETVKVDVTIGTVTYDSTKKQIVINDAQGNTTKTLTSGKDYKITDKDGNVYLVSKDNKITKQPKATETTVKNGGPAKDGGLNTDLYFVEGQPILTFVAHPQQTWAFDAMEMNSMADILYESVSNDLEAYYVPYKSVGSAGSDKVMAKVYANPKNVDLKRIKFKTNTGVAVPFEYDPQKQEWTLTLTGTLHRQDFSVFPFYGDGKDTLCGKLNVMPLDRKEVNLVLVPLNGYKAGNVKQVDIENYLNKVYHQANIAYKVSIDNAFSTAAADLPLSVEHGKLEGEYSENQAQVIVDYQVAHPEQDNTIYMFLCKEGSNEAVKGHTPVNRSYGFLFGEALEQRTFAHEVGHGYPLALEHPFTSGGATGTYSNLMDYATATNLSFKQWGLAHNPKLKVRFGQDAKQGELNVSELEQLFDWLVKNRGKKVKYDKSVYKTYDSWNTFIKYGYDGGKSGLYVELNGSCDVDLDLKYVEVIIEKHTCGMNFIMSFMRPDRSGEFIRIWAASHSSYELLLKRLGLRLTDVMRAEVISDYQNLISTSGKGCNDIDIIYENIPSYVLDRMRYADKVDAIKTLLACDADQVCVDEESALLNLVKSIKDSEINPFFDELGRNGFFMALYRALDGENSERNLAILTDKYYRSKYYNPTLTGETHRNTFLFHGYSMFSGNSVIIVPKGDKFYTTVNAHTPTGMDHFELDPFATVQIISKVKLPYLRSQQNIGDRFYVVKVPVLYLRMLEDKEANNSAKELAGVAVAILGNAYTFGIGGAMTGSTSNIVRAIGYLDMISAGAGTITMVSKPAVEAKYGKESTTYKVIDKIDLILNIYNGARFAMDIIGLPKLIDDAKPLWKLEKKRIKDDKLLSDADCKKVDELLGEKTIDIPHIVVVDDYFKNVDQFAATFDSKKTFSPELRQEAFDLYAQHKWKELEDLFHKNKMNFDPGIGTEWPPASGGYFIEQPKDFVAGQIYDRYQENVDASKSLIDRLSGSFTSPMDHGKPFSYEKRALNPAETENALYYEIKILKPMPFKGEDAKVIPWFGKVGHGVQTKFMFPSDRTWSWEKLINAGYVEVNIKASPNGTLNEMIGIIFSKSTTEVLDNLKDPSLINLKTSFLSSSPVEKQLFLEDFKHLEFIELKTIENEGLYNTWKNYRTSNINLLKKIKIDNILKLNLNEKSEFERVLAQYVKKWKTNSSYIKFKNDFEGLYQFNLSKGIGGVEMEAIGAVKIREMAKENSEELLEGLKIIFYNSKNTQKTIHELDYVAVKNNKISNIYSAKYKSGSVNLNEYRSKLLNAKEITIPPDITRAEVKWNNGSMTLEDFRIKYLNNTDIPNLAGKGVIPQTIGLADESSFVQIPMTKEEWLIEFTKFVYKMY